jgi:large subunit ribosomal protein L25
MSTQEETIIKAEKRTLKGKQVSQLRRVGILPGVIYGHKIESQAIQMDRHTVSQQMSRITPTTLVTVDVDGNKIKAFVRDRQRDVLHGVLTHLDFLAISMTEKMRASVALELTGEAPVLDDAIYLLNQNLNELEIECLPQDMPERVMVDVSGIKTPEDTITVADLDLGEGVSILTDNSEVIVSVSYVAVEEAEEEEEPEFGFEGPEVLEKGKKIEGEEEVE